MAAGVYEIVCRTNGKRYIGSSANIRQRMSSHRSRLRRGRHTSTKLQRAWLKYGEDAFEFRVLLICAQEDTLLYEQRAIDAYAAVSDGYNISPTAGKTFGYKHTDISRAKMTASHTGKVFSPEHRAKLAARVISPEHRAKLRAALIGRPRPEHIREILRRNISIKSRVVSPETRAKIGAANRGKPRTAEWKAAVSAATKGRPKSEAFKAHLRAFYAAKKLAIIQQSQGE